MSIVKTKGNKVRDRADMPSIYAIKNTTSDLVYYGSTNNMKKRWGNHKCKNNRSRSRIVMACPTAYYEVVEEVSEEDRKMRERWWIDNHPCVNTQRPLRTQAENEKAWRRANPDKAKAKRERYLENPVNKETAKAATKAWRDAHRDEWNATQREWRRKKREATQLSSS
jgi:predicted GIY-YIG superfamily endonuclease